MYHNPIIRSIKTKCIYVRVKIKLERCSKIIRKVEIFLPTNEQPQLFRPRDLVFISGKYVIEKLEQCITVSYASVVNNENPNREFDISDVPECIPHCMISVTANCKPKEVEDYIYFGVESVEYNSVTSSSAVRMQMTVLYSSQNIRFQKYLGTSGSNIKLGNTYFVSGFFKFSKSDQIIIEATDIDYLRTSALNYNIFKNSSLVDSKHRSIIDIIADDIKSIFAQTPLKRAESSASLSKPGDVGAFESTETLIDASVKTRR
ncbi:26964_t:CDS:2 [Gigaspora margarita]|uniref:26964_t:CDS:1 n=1 Tax=Gigaspora margarita TaxID=4874 RepID=A0ABM8W354_GIGMA|nr:26964_t:CDS:2 [Gigaspora margarita]